MSKHPDDRSGSCAGIPTQPILVCKHGQQARVCEMCDLERENARLLDVIADMSKQLAACQGREEGKQLIIQQLERQLAEAKNEDLEMAAKMCESVSDELVDSLHIEVANNCAKSIRAMKG